MRGDRGEGGLRWLCGGVVERVEGVNEVGFITTMRPDLSFLSQSRPFNALTNIYASDATGVFLRAPVVMHTKKSIDDQGVKEDPA